MKSRLSRPYLSRLEQDLVDPSFSVVRRLAGALDLTIGELCDSLPDTPRLNRHAFDEISRSALYKSNKAFVAEMSLKGLHRAFREQRVVLGLLNPRSASHQSPRSGDRILKKLRVKLGEAQWQVFLSRLDKLASAVLVTGQK